MAHFAYWCRNRRIASLSGSPLDSAAARAAVHVAGVSWLR